MKEFLIVLSLALGVIVFTNRDFVHWVEHNFNPPWLRNKPRMSDGGRFLLGSMFILMGLFFLFLYLT